MNQDYQNLPKRQINKQNSKFKTVKILTNQYQFKHIKKNSIFYLYEITSKPQLQKDMNYLYAKMLARHYNEIDKLIKVYTRSGNYIWGTEKLNVIKTIKYKDSNEIIQFFMRLIKEIQYVPKNMIQIKHMLNSKTKQIVRKQLGFIQMGKNVYFQNHIFAQQNRLGIKAMKGFEFTICYIDKMLFLQINRKIRMLRQQNFLQTLNKENRKYDDFCKGKKVMKNYGNKGTHQIIQIDFKMNPLSTFKDNEGNDITYKDYYLRYNKQIQDLKQPLLKCQSHRPKAKINKQNKQIQYQREILYLVPELVSLVLTTSKNQRYEQNFTRLIRPDPRTKLIQIQQDFICQVNSKNSEIKINNMRETIGYKAENVQIKLKNNTLVAYGGSFKIKQQIIQSTAFQDILIVYSVGKYQQQDQYEIDQIFKLFKLAGKSINIKIQVKIEDCCLQIKKNQKDYKEWIKSIDDNIKKYTKPEIILVAFQQYQTYMYNDIKLYLTDQLKINSQFFTRKKLRQNNSKPLSIATNILIQMAVKFDKIIWQVKSSINRKVILGSMIIQKQKNKYFAVLNGSRNIQRSKYYNQRKTLKSKAIDKESFQGFLHAWIKCSVKQGGFIPQIIVFYRLEINQPSQKQIYQQQISIFNQQFQSIKKTKIKDFNPTLIYITVTLKSSTKIFQNGGGNISGSFAQNAINPEPGLIMYGQNQNQFYLITAKCNQGCANPVKYTVRQNSSELCMDQIIQLTFEQCHNYQNWQGSIRIPSVLQNSIKYSRFPSSGNEVIRGSLDHNKFYV